MNKYITSTAIDTQLTAYIAIFSYGSNPTMCAHAFMQDENAREAGLCTVLKVGGVLGRPVMWTPDVLIRILRYSYYI